MGDVKSSFGMTKSNEFDVHHTLKQEHIHVPQINYIPLTIVPASSGFQSKHTSVFTPASN